MARELFKDMKLEEPDSDRKEYIPPEEELVDSKLVKELLGYYIKGEYEGGENFCSKFPAHLLSDFESVVDNIESIIKDTSDELRPQFLIDLLTRKLRDESDHIYKWTYSFPRTYYLTAVVQALYNLDYGDEFLIDISGWPEYTCSIGAFLKGEPDNPLTLNLYGNLIGCGGGAEHCNFILRGRATYGSGTDAVNCNFTFYDKVKECGWGAENCRFDLMPGADIEIYAGYILGGNVQRRMNKEGVWEIIG